MPLAAAIGPIISGIASAAPAISGIAGAASSIYGAVNQGNAINNASQAQQQAGQQAIAEQQREFDTNQTNLQPFLHGGQQALSAQMALLGLGGGQGGGSGFGGAPNYSAYVQNNPDLLAAYNANPGNQSIDQFGQWHWGQYGQNEVTNGGRAYTPFGPKDSGGAAGPQTGAQAQQSAIDALKNGPLFQSIYGTGRDAILANAAATGGLRGGNTQNSLARFSGDTLAQVIQNQIQNLGQVAGQGQSAGNSLGALGQASAGNISNLINQNGANRAGGILGSAGANSQLATSLSTLPSLFGNSSFLKALGVGGAPNYINQDSALPSMGIF